MKYYSATKRNGVLISITAWMNLENNMLSERSQVQKTKYCNVHRDIFIGTESRLAVARYWWEGTKGSDC